jgi:hypothetical protein
MVCPILVHNFLVPCTNRSKGPPLPENTLFAKGDMFRQFFYAKLLNAERACYAAPILSNKLIRTRTAMLKDIAHTFL